MAVTFFLREELLYRREDHTASSDLKEAAKVCTILGLNRRLTQRFVATGKRSEELIVKIVAICDHDNRRILHGWMKNQPSSVEQHRETLARALSVPSDTGSLFFPL